MALFIRQDDNRTELQKRLNAELTEKAKKKAEWENKPQPDGVKDSTYIKDTQMTGNYAWVWLVLIGLIVTAVVVFMFATN